LVCADYAIKIHQYLAGRGLVVQVAKVVALWPQG